MWRVRLATILYPSGHPLTKVSEIRYHNCNLARKNTKNHTLQRAFKLPTPLKIEAPWRQGNMAVAKESIGDQAQGQGFLHEDIYDTGPVGCIQCDFLSNPSCIGLSAQLIQEL